MQSYATSEEQQMLQAAKLRIQQAKEAAQQAQALKAQQAALAAQQAQLNALQVSRLGDLLLCLAARDIVLITWPVSCTVVST